jgi:D-tyrosyl-tRNA(Tyr) deacylase
MRTVLQRVSSAAVSVEGQIVGQIGRGLVILVGVGYGDGEEQAAWLARKISGLRIFEDQAGKFNLSLLDVEGSALVISQFTLYADTRKGRRPAFVAAATPDVAEPLITRFCALLRGYGMPVQTGVFGAHMLVEINNDGPVTVILDTDAR